METLESGEQFPEGRRGHNLTIKANLEVSQKYITLNFVKT
jgi:hypothetical protein